jgi:putative transposase
VLITINGKKHWLWRAADQFGIVLDVLVQSRRDRYAAQRLMRKLLRKYGVSPRVLVTDKLKSYAAANKDIGLKFEHRQHNGLNNRAENSHQPTRVREKVTRRFKSACQLQRFGSVHEQVANLFHRRRYNVSATEKRTNRNQALAAWEGVTCANTFGIQAA